MPCAFVQLAQPLQELIGRDDVAALALDRLDDDRGDFVGRDEVHEQLMLDDSRGTPPRSCPASGRADSDSSPRYGAWYTPGISGPKPRR